MLSKPIGHNFTKLKQSMAKYPRLRESSAKYATSKNKLGDMANMFHMDYF